MPGKGAFDRCVESVAARGGALDPAAVCASAGRRKYGKRKFQAMAAAGKRRKHRQNLWPFDSFKKTTVGHVKSGRKSGVVAHHKGVSIWKVADGGDSPFSVPSIDRESRFDSVKDAKQFIGAQSNRGRKRRKNHGRRPNPVDAARARYESFHGKPSEELIEVRTRMHTHDVLSGIGDLVKLVIIPLKGRKVVVSDFDGAILSQNEKATQLFIEGGDQEVDVRTFGVSWEPHELEKLGECDRVYYHTDKRHLGKDGGDAIYNHKFGGVVKVNGKWRRSPKPTIVYDTVNKLLAFAGGGYTIPDEGIDG